MTAGWPSPGGVWGRWKDKLPRLDHPVVSALTNTPASPRLASVSARKCFRIAPCPQRVMQCVAFQSTRQ